MKNTQVTCVQCGKVIGAAGLTDDQRYEIMEAARLAAGDTNGGVVIE